MGTNGCCAIAIFRLPRIEADKENTMPASEMNFASIGVFYDTTVALKIHRASFPDQIANRHDREGHVRVLKGEFEVDTVVIRMDNVGFTPVGD